MIIQTKAELADSDGPIVDFRTDEGPIDLHNFANFDRLEYTSNGTASLKWASAESGRFTVNRKPIRSAKLTFQSVVQFSVLPRDLEMPASEDQALQDYEVVRKDAAWHVKFAFESGREILLRLSSPFVQVEIEAVDPAQFDSNF